MKDGRKILYPDRLLSPMKAAADITSPLTHVSELKSESRQYISSTIAQPPKAQGGNEAFKTIVVPPTAQKGIWNP